MSLNGNEKTIKDYLLEVAKGNIPGQSSVNKFGANISITANTREDIWDGGGTYVFPTTADITHIAQAADQVALRGGAIEVQGLDANWDLLVQTVNLNATDTSTLTALSTPLIRVFRMKVMTGVIADSDILLTNAGVSQTYSIITTDNNQTLMAIYTVPRGYTAYITHYFASNTESTGKEPKSTDIMLKAADRGNGYEFQLKHAIGIPKAGSSINHNFAPYMKVGEKTDIKMSAYCTDEIGHVHSGFDLILVKN